jgi:Flp pilus assembly protein TadD
LKNALFIVTFSSLLAACASPVKVSDVAATPVKPAMAAASPADAVAAASSELAAALEAPTVSPTVDPLPNVALSDELLFKLLTAEIAYQRGEWQTAYVTTFVVAQQTRDPRIARRAAEMAIGAKQNGEALAAVRLWHDLEPHSEEAAQYLLGFIVLSDELDSAEPMFAQRLAEARPMTRGLMLLQIQRMLTRARDKADAFSLLERLVAPYLNTAEAHIALAQGAWVKADAARAINEARIAVTLNPMSELAILTLSQVVPDKDEAGRVLTNFLKAHPESREVRLAHARLQIDQKQYAKARAEFEALLKLQPDDLSSLYALGVLASQSNDAKSAEKYLSSYVKALGENPDDERDPTQALLILAQIAEERKDIPAALSWLEQIEGGESFIPAQIRRAQLMHKQGDLNGGLNLLHELKPDAEREKVQLIVAEGNLLQDAGRATDGMAVMEFGLARFPNEPDLLYDFAMMAEKNSRFELMETTLRRLIKLAPKNQHAYNALGYSLAERNIRLPEAFELIETALSITPDDAFILDSMGWVQFRLGRLKEAEDALRRAYQLRPDAEIAVHLGEVLWVKGEKDKAHKMWRDATDKDPQNDTLKNTLARLNVSL